MLRTLAFSFLVLLAALPAVAQAGTPFTIGRGNDPHLLVDPDGTAHVAWEDETAEKVKYCKVLRGGTACAAPSATLDMPGSADSGNPFLVRGEGGALHIAMPHYVLGATLLWTSNDNGMSWVSAAPVKIYNRPNTTDATEPVAGPQPGQITFAAWNPSRQIWAASTDGSESESTAAASPPNPGGISSLMYDLAIAPTEDGGLLAAANTLERTYFWRMAPGSDPSESASWSDPTDLGEMNTSRVAGGAGGAYVLTIAGSVNARRMEIRKFAGGSMGAPTELSREYGLGPDLTVGPSTAVGAVWRRNGDPNRVVHALSTNDGASYTVSTIARDDSGLAGLYVSLANDAKGFAVWKGKGTGVPNEAEIRLADTEPVAEPVATPGPSTPTTTPSPTPRPDVRPGTTPRVPRAGLRRTVAAVRGATLTLTVPEGCVPAGRPFSATLSWRRQRRRGNVFIKVSRVDFFIGSRRVVTDRRAPFRQRLSIPRPQRGQSYRLRARATIKVRRGVGPKKSIVTTLRVCS